MPEGFGYLLWIEFLKRSDPAKWTKQVREDFVSCLGADTGKWFNDNRHLWSGPRKEPLTPKPYRGQEPEPHHVVMLIDVRAPDDKLHARIQEFVDAGREEIGWQPLKGRPRYAARDAKYFFTARPEVEALQIALEAYDYKKKKPDDPLWKVGEHLTRAFPIARNVKAKDEVNKRKELASLASKYLKRAEANIKSVVRGVFPA